MTRPTCECYRDAVKAYDQLDEIHRRTHIARVILRQLVAENNQRASDLNESWASLEPWLVPRHAIVTTKSPSEASSQTPNNNQHPTTVTLPSIDNNNNNNDMSAY